jgi:hypothetical protein
MRKEAASKETPELTEGYLLQVLQGQFGPQIGASPTALLSVIGRNMVGRVQSPPPARYIRLKWLNCSKGTTRSRPSLNSFANTQPAACLAFCLSFLTSMMGQYFLIVNTNCAVIQPCRLSIRLLHGCLSHMPWQTRCLRNV